MVQRWMRIQGSSAEVSQAKLVVSVPWSLLQVTSTSSTGLLSRYTGEILLINNHPLQSSSVMQSSKQISWAPASHMIYPHQLRNIILPTSPRPASAALSSLYFTEAAGLVSSMDTGARHHTTPTQPATRRKQRLSRLCKILLVPILITQICSAPMNSIRWAPDSSHQPGA